MRPTTGRFDRRPSTGKSVRFSGGRTGPVDDDTDPTLGETDGYRPTYEDEEEIIRKLENPHTEVDSDDDSLPVGNDSALIRGQAPPTYPSTAPPPYQEEDEDDDDGLPSPDINSPREERDRREKIDQMGNISEPKRGSVQEMVSKITQPFSSMMKPMGGSDESDDDMDTIDHLTEEEQWLLDLISSKDLRLENINIKPQLQPFIVDFIPAIGDIDAFIKIPRPDEVEDNAGLTQLDEPAAKQSDPTILDMQMRSAAKELTTQEDAPVKRLTRADQNKDEINNWISNIKELHRSRAPPSVNFKGPMPDIEKLMQEWPQDFEKKLSGLKLPTADLDCSLDEFTDLCCNLADIPVGHSRIHSLYQFFSLYAQFKNSQHFKNLDHNRAQSSRHVETTERLEL